MKYKYKYNVGVKSTRFEKGLVIAALIFTITSLIAFGMVMTNTPTGVSLTQYLIAGN